MKTKTSYAAFFCLVFFSSVPAQTPDKAKLDQFLDRLAEKNKGMGSLTVAKDGKVLYGHSFGYSYVSATEKKPATAATKYRIGSITKTYTAVMVFQLVEEGKLKLTDTLDRFFPQIPNAKKITIAHMLGHRSGIPNFVADGSWAHQPRTKEEVVARIAQAEPDFEPGSKFHYSNTGYNLLGQIVEKAGGQTYQDALKERITSRAGLNDTYSLEIGNTNTGRNESLSYMFMGDWKEATEIDFSVTGGAGSIVATPMDLAKFVQALFDFKLVSETSLKQMTTMREGEGLGLVSFSFAGKTLYGNTGGSSTSGAWLAYYPEEKLALAYATNMKIYPVVNIVRGVFDIYWNRPFEIPTFDALEVSPEVLDLYVGIYSTPDAPAKLAITRRGTTLYFQPPGQSAVSLEATAQDKFKIDPAVFLNSTRRKPDDRKTERRRKGFHERKINVLKKPTGRVRRTIGAAQQEGIRGVQQCVLPTLIATRFL